jgi:uncharacterized protein YndB with AHSA1/START domain
MTPAKTDTLADRTFTVKRTMRAPAAKIFAAYTDPLQVPQWWGPKGDLRVEGMDVRPGGTFRYLQKGPDGRTVTYVGSYLEVKPVTRLVYTFKMEGQPGQAVITTVDLAEDAGATAVTVTLEFSSKEALEAAAKFGAMAGAKWALDNLARYLGVP